MKHASRVRILTLNAGSSSLKFGLFDVAETGLQRRYAGEISHLDSTPKITVASASGQLLCDGEAALAGHAEPVGWLLDWLKENIPQISLGAVGHRVVHGGAQYADPVRIDQTIIDELQSLVTLAPLHLPHNLAAIQTIQQQYPALPQVACFDTAFHRSMAWREQTYALPRQWFDKGIRRYGFHGLSYEYIASTMARQPNINDQSRIVVAHLGFGASLCAMRGGKSIATTMGFTPLDGIPMATRCGAIDPGVILWLIDEAHLSPHDVGQWLNHKSGLLGLSGMSPDMEALLQSNERSAAEAIDYFVHHTQRAIASLAGAMGGIDAIVFTGGIGEHSATIRERICHAAAWLGIELDSAANHGNKMRISTTASPVSVWRIRTDEESVIAQHTYRLTSHVTST